jgi:hypothetical protein
MQMKGFWRTMESVLAALIIMSFLATAGNVYLANTGDGEPASNGYEKLKELDALGELRPLAAAKDYAAISSMIDAPGYNRSVMICDFSGNCWGNYTAAQLESGNVLASTYIISGHASYEPLEIRLYMWR